MMRTPAIVTAVVQVALGVSFAVASHAEDQNAGAVNGKWGIGAGFGNGATEITLIRGHSEKTAWLLTTRFDYARSAVDDASSTGLFPLPMIGDQSRTALAVGPGVRRFLAPSSVLTPYVDVSALYLYQRTASSFNGGGNETTLNGAEGDVAIGGEYFTPWRFSLAVHSVVASFQWVQRHDEMHDSTGSASQRSHTVFATAGLRPVLFARVYF